MKLVWFVWFMLYVSKVGAHVDMLKKNLYDENIVLFEATFFLSVKKKTYQFYVHETKNLAPLTVGKTEVF